jgi:hypothetical protein
MLSNCKRWIFIAVSLFPANAPAEQIPQWSSVKTEIPVEVKWKQLPVSDKTLNPDLIRWEVILPELSVSPGVRWVKLPPGAPDFIATDTFSGITPTPKPPLPSLQSLNRSIAFSDGTPGPDLAWKVPQGFRWSEHWFMDVGILGANTRPSNSGFWAWNNGDAAGEAHIRVIQDNNWSFGINATFRSVYQGSNFDGGTTPIGDGFATGFRFDYSLSTTSGIALGSEQLIQFDSNNDSGRNLYIVGSKGWWLGRQPRSFPLLIGTAGVGTGRLGDNANLQFGCIEEINASISLKQSLPLCWSPIGSAALLFNPNFSLFSEYNSQDWLAGLSLNINNGFPLRLSWGALLGNKGTNYSYVGAENMRWFFRVSLGL